jgi:hypothetical protein
VCSQTFSVAPQEIVAIDVLAPAGTIAFRAYPDLSLALPSLPASTQAQGLVADAQNNLYFFDANNKLAKSAPPYTSSAPVSANYTSTNNTRLTYEAATGDLDIADPTGLHVSAPPYSSTFQPVVSAPNIVYGINPADNAVLVANGGGGLIAGSYSSFAGNGNDSFDAVYCPTGFGAGFTSDALLMTYNGSGNPSVALEWTNPGGGGPVTAFPGGVEIAQQAYQVACDLNGYVTIWYNGALNRFAPGATAVTTSVAAPFAFAQPYGLVTDAVGNVFYAQTSGLLAWDGTSSAVNAISLTFTPGNLAIVP